MEVLTCDIAELLFRYDQVVQQKEIILNQEAPGAEMERSCKCGMP